MTHLTKLFWAVIGGVIAVVGSLVVSYLTEKAPDLVYEAFPPSHVATDTTDVSIYNVRIDNAGNREAAAVQVYMALPDGRSIDEIQVTPSLVAIAYSTTRKSNSAFLVDLPSLNARESVQFSLLVQRADNAPMKVEVRGRDAAGRARTSTQPTKISATQALIEILPIVLGLLFVLGVVAIAQESRSFFHRMFSRQLQTLRTQIGPNANRTLNDADLATVLSSAQFRFFFNPSSSLDKNKLMRFGPNGTILEGRNENESSWRTKNGLFEFVSSKGSVNSRFYYSPNDRIFYQIPDRDTAAVAVFGIGDQYLMAVAAVPEKKN